MTDRAPQGPSAFEREFKKGDRVELLDPTDKKMERSDYRQIILHPWSYFKNQGLLDMLRVLKDFR